MSESDQTSTTTSAVVTEVTPDTVRRHLLRILSSEAFQGSRRSGALLEAVIEARLENRKEDLKEHRLAQRFFPDLAGFRSSSIYKMRGVFKRLRGRLQAYYRTDGRFDEVIIGFPHGLYVPEFALRSGRAAELAVAAPETVFITPMVEPAPLAAASAPVEPKPSPAPAAAAEEPVESVLPPAPKPAKRTRRRRQRKEHEPKIRATAAGYRWSLALAIGSVPVLAGVGLLLSSRTEVLAPLPEYRSSIRLTNERELALDATLSSNGKYVVYASDRESPGNLNIWMIALDDKARTPKRVTKSEFEENQPSISPDGSTVAYYSQRDGGGVFIASTKGDEPPRKLVGEGRRPRFSPDGTKIAYWSLNRTGGAVESRLYVIPVKGGTPRQLVPGFMNAEHPAWSPNGERILFSGRPMPPAPKNPEDEPIPEPIDWWVTTLDDSPPVRTNALPTGTSDILFGPPGVWTPYTNRILADSMQAGQRRPVAVAMDPGFKRMGGTETLNFKGIANGQPFLAAGRLVSSRIDIFSQIASIPVNPATGQAAGPAQVLSKDNGGNEFLAALNAGGTQLSYVAERNGSFNAYTKDVAAGTERRLSNIPQGWSPMYSRDGRYLAVLYPTMGQPGTAGGSGALEIHGPAGASKPISCDRCERVVAISNDGQKMLYLARNPRNPAWIGTLDLATKTHSTVLGHPYVITSADWSPSQRVIAFGNRMPGKGTQIMAVSYSGSGEAGEPVAVLPTGHNDDRPRFSPDGRFLYFTSDRDGFQCLYSVRVDGTRGTALEEPRPVHHFHQRRLAIDAVPAPVQVLSLSADRIALTVQSVRSGIFFAER